MDNKPIDVAGEVAKATHDALNEINFDPHMSSRFEEQFVRFAGDNMARPERPEDVEYFAGLAADKLLSDSEFRGTLVTLIARGLREYMRPV